jgi:hypothetical protein
MVRKKQPPRREKPDAAKKAKGNDASACAQEISASKPGAANGKVMEPRMDADARNNRITTE